MVKAATAPARELLRLDLGCGNAVKDGFVGVDIAARKIREGIIECDLFSFPWPWEDESVAEVNCSHFFEHVPARLRFGFMDELFRVLIPNGKATIITPYAWSSRAVQDPTHEWPPIVEASYLYFNKKWREDNGLSHYNTVSDFDFAIMHSLAPTAARWAQRHEEVRRQACENYINVIADMSVTLTKNGGSKVEDKRA